MPIPLPHPASAGRTAALAERLESLGLLGPAGPALGLDAGPDAGSPAGVDFHPDADAGGRAAVLAEVAAWDWSEAADASHRKASAKVAAKLAFADEDGPTRVAARNADRALYRSIVQARNKVNELITWANAQGASISPLTKRTFAQAMAGAKALVDAETDPAGD